MTKIIDEILEKAKAKSDTSEVFHTSTESTACAWGSDKLQIAEAKESSGVALRVLIDGKMGFFATSKLDDADLIVNTACDLAKLGSSFEGELPSTFTPSDVDTWDEPTAGIEADTLVEAGNTMVSKAKDGNSEALYDGKLARNIIHATIANTHGARTSFRKTAYEGYLMGQLTREGDVLMLYEFDMSPKMADQQDKWADIVIQKFKDAANIVPLPPGQYPCVMTPMAMQVAGPVMSAMNARMVTKDMSPFKDKVGEQVFDERINIFDDGLNPDMTSSQPVDDEGVTAQNTTLIENGVLKGFINDLHTSAILDVEPTGNGMRGGLSAAPRAGYSTLTIKPGEKTLEEMISGMEKGVIIDQIMGAHQASPFSGDFSVSISVGLVVENGKIIGRFKDGMLAGNVFNMLKSQVVEIGSEMKSVSGYLPPILFDGMTIATAG